MAEIDNEGFCRAEQQARKTTRATHAADLPRREPWYVGAQNDGLYIIDRPPSPSNDHPDHDRDCRVVAKVYRQPDEDAVARNLAAAPKLLEACEHAPSMLDPYQHDVEPIARAIDLARGFAE